MDIDNRRVPLQVKVIQEAAHETDSVPETGEGIPGQETPRSKG